MVSQYLSYVQESTQKIKRRLLASVEHFQQVSGASSYLTMVLCASAATASATQIMKGEGGGGVSYWDGRGICVGNLKQMKCFFVKTFSPVYSYYVRSDGGKTFH